MDDFYRYSEQVVYGYKSVGLFERLICTWWYLVVQRWNWIFHGK